MMYQESNPGCSIENPAIYQPSHPDTHSNSHTIPITLQFSKAEPKETWHNDIKSFLALST